MARIDDLVNRIDDLALRNDIVDALAPYRDQKRFGLIFEQHLPESRTLFGLRPHVGDTIVRRDAPPPGTRYLVQSLGSDDTVVLDDPDTTAVPIGDVLVVKSTGDTIYPTLAPLGHVQGGNEAQPYHTVIDAENYDALRLLNFVCAGSVDCIYIDPPYNTGATDWKYNNDYVDKQDDWRHSKWLNFMERRLRAARTLLKEDSVLIVTIDDNEVHHLGLLLEQLFPDARCQMVTICINPSGASGEGLSRAGEYAFFCFFGNAKPVRVPDDLLAPKPRNSDYIRWESLMRGGNAWYRAKRTNLCYPILLDEAGEHIVGAGDPMPYHNDPVADEREERERPRRIDGHPVVWPVRKDGKLGIWRVNGPMLLTLVGRGFAYVSSRDEEQDTWTIRYLLKGTIEKINQGLIEVQGQDERGKAILRRLDLYSTVAKTIWHRDHHTAGGAGGTHMLYELLGQRNLFSYPKAVLAVRDCLAVAVGDNKDALIVDFFAGSGTTFHATCALNAQDGGTRRTILVTNNEVSKEVADNLRRHGCFPGDDRFSEQGIFAQVTRPRCEAVVQGHRADGQVVEGEDVPGIHAMAEGYAENIEFFRLIYLDPDEVDLGRQFAAITPLLWLGASAVGERERCEPSVGYSLPHHARYAVVFSPSAFAAFRVALRDRPDVTHVWFVTDSVDAYQEMSAALPRHIWPRMLYRDYLVNFRIKIGEKA